MKSRILGQTNKNENYPLFNSQTYRDIQTDLKKQEYLLNYLQFFLSRLDQQNIQRQKINPLLFQSFKDFSEIFSQSYSLLLPDSFNNIIKILSIENSILETIPNASNFLQLIDLIFYQCFQQSDTIIQKDSSNAVFALFSNKSFRKAFINSGKYSETVMALINYSNPQLTNYFYDFFLNDKFIQCLIEEDIAKNINENEDGEYLKCSKFILSYFSKLFLSETTKDEIRYQLIEFGSKLIIHIFNGLEKNQKVQYQISNLFINELSKLKLFEKSNNFFILHPSLCFMSMFYNNLLLNLNSKNNNKQFNQIVLKHLNNLYKDNRFSIEDGKVVIMHFFQTLNINYFSNKNNFLILDWFDESVFTSSLLFQVTSSFITKCVYYNTNFLSSFIDFFLQKISPPAKENFVYNEIFSWFLSLIFLLIEDDKNVLTNIKNEDKFCFDAHNFLQIMFYEPSIDDISFYLKNFFNFRQLLLHITILSKEYDKRNSNPKKSLYAKNNQIIRNNNVSVHFNDSIFNEQYFTRIIELIDYNINIETIQEFLVSYLKNSFGKNLVLYFFHNICSSNHTQSLLFSFAQEFTNELIEVISSYKLLDIIVKNINEKNFAIIIKIINYIVIKTNNHFFDDYIINNTQIDSPIFKMNFISIEKYILPAFYDEPIPIPSLIPFLFQKEEQIINEKLIFKSPYNHYLLGYYTMPIYNRFNIPISNIICLEKILNQFIRYKDFCYVFQNGPEDALIRIQAGKSPEFPFNIFEIFPSETPSSIILNLSSAYSAFKIRFETKHHLPSVLFNINEAPLLFIKDDYLIDISNTSIGKIQLSKWYIISFFYNKNTKILSIGLNNEIVSSLSISSKDSVVDNYKINSIGSLQKPPLIHYMIMNTVAIGNTQDQSAFSEEIASKYFKPQGNVLFVPNYSYHHLFESRYAFTRFCKIIENTIKDSNAHDQVKKQYHDKTCLFVSLLSNWIITNNVSSGWFLNRYRYCLMQNVSYCEPIYLTSILQTIIHLNDKKNRTKLFYYFICDFFFWTIFPEKIVGQCLDLINNFIDNISSVFDFKMIEETTFGNFLLSLTYFFKNSYLFNGLIRFVRTVFSVLDEKYVAPILSNFASISPYLNVNEMEMIFDFEKGQNYGNIIISLAKDIQTTRNIKIFKVEELLSFALMLKNQQLAINFIMQILQLCDSDQFVQQYLSILCRMISRFSSNNLIWQKLFQLITNDKAFILSFGSNSSMHKYNFNNGIRISILPLVLSALIPLFNEDTMFSENIKKLVFQLLKENQLNLISKPAIKIFCAFLRGSIFGNVPSNFINQQISQYPKVKDFYSIFIDNVNRTFVSSKRPNISFYQFTSMLFCSILLSQVSNLKRFSMILNIAAHSSNYFLIQMLITFFSTYLHIELPTQQLTLLNDISLYALLNEKDIILRDDLSNNAFVYCIHNHDRFAYFSKFFVFSYKYVSSDVKFRNLRSFKEFFSIQPPKSLNEIIPYLYIIVCTDLNQFIHNNKTKIEDPNKKNIDESPKRIVSNDGKRRLMNLKVKETIPNSVKNDDQINSLAFEIFDYFKATFNQFPKESKLSLLLKYKDFKDLILHQNNADFVQVKNYISNYMINLQDESYNCYKIMEIKGVAIPQDNLGIFLFNHFSDIAQKCNTFFNTLFSDINNFLRHVEKYYGSFIYINNTIISQNFSNNALFEKCPNCHISPFYFPGVCPVVLIPSPFTYFKEDEKKYLNIEDEYCSNKIETSLFGLEKQNSFAYLDSDISVFKKFGGYFDYQNQNHRMKIAFIHNTNVKTQKINVDFLHLNSENKNQQKIILFISIYGRPLQIFNCSIIRRFIDIPAVLFKYKNRYLILTFCSFDGEEINFINQNSNTKESIYNLTINQSFYQSVFLNEFGQYYLFLGHPVILVQLNDFIISHQCTDDTVTFSVGIFSSSNGSFVLSFSREDVMDLQQKYQQQVNDQLQENNVVYPPSIYMLTTPNSLKQGIIEKWLKGSISNIHYLTLLNLISGRSFDDLASYPIMPRVVSSFDGNSFDEIFHKNLRNLQFPISVISEALKSKSPIEIKEKNCNSSYEYKKDDFDIPFDVDLSDPCFNTLKMRYEIQKYHNCENISNGSIVSSFLIRIAPFINYSLEFNDGNFDAPERMFSSIEVSCNINKFSTSEIIPELFLLPEMLTNKTSRIKFPENFSNDVILPQWIHTIKSSNEKIECYNFIMMHRRIIESISVRKQISKWIDLVFGFKQSGEEAINSFNVYNPLSYQSSVGSLPILSKSASTNIPQYKIKTIRADFVKNSGQMPLKIFSTPHEPYSFEKPVNKENIISNSSSFVLKEKRSSPIKNRVQTIFDKNTLFGFSFEDIVVCLKQSDNDDCILNRMKGDISIKIVNTVFKLFNSDFFNAMHISLSKKGDFLAVTYCTSKVKIFRLFYFDFLHRNQGLLVQHPNDGENSFSFSEMAVLSRESICFSILNDRQLLCATVCKEEVVLWSIVNGFIIHIIPMKNVKCLTFDEELNLIYIGVDTRIHQFSINGQLLRTIETDLENPKKSDQNIFKLSDSVESLAVGGFGFSYDTRFIAVGKSSGNVMIFRQNNETLDFEIISIFEVSNYPIVKLIAKQNNLLIEAIDSYKSSSPVFK